MLQCVQFNSELENVKSKLRCFSGIYRNFIFCGLPVCFLPARRYASAGLCDSDVSVCLSVCLSHAGIVPSRAKAGS